MLCLLCRRLASGRRGSAAGQRIHIREYAGCFYFEKLFRLLVVRFRKFSSAVFETQVTQIFVYRVAALHQLVEFGAMRRGIRTVRLNHKYENNCRCSEQSARDRDVHATHRNLFQSRAEHAPETRRESPGLKRWPMWPYAASDAPQPKRERTLIAA